MRPIRIRPWIAGLILGTAFVTLTGFVGAVGYLVYRDDLLGSTFARQVRMQYEYEDRISALRSELDRATSRHAIQTQGVEEQVAALLDRQDTIQRRQAALDSLLDRARGEEIDLARVAEALPSIPATLEPPEQSVSPLDPAALAYVAAPAHSAEIITGSLIAAPVSAGLDGQRDLKPILSRVDHSLMATQVYQTEALDALAAAAEKEAQRLSSALAPIGVTAQPIRSKEPQGGPFIPAGNLHFVERAAVLNRTLDDITNLRRAADALPLARPVAGAKVSSRFGYRNDPFLNRPALHAGIDFVAHSGTEVRATGSGTVVSAGWQGGYGQLVEIRHENGISTRYGHLSAVLVRTGQKVGRGALIGRVGSTGRSTGPHLHYETRRGGQPVNPSVYLAAGAALQPR